MTSGRLPRFIAIFARRQPGGIDVAPETLYDDSRVLDTLSV